MLTFHERMKREIDAIRVDAYLTERRRALRAGESDYIANRLARQAQDEAGWQAEEDRGLSFCQAYEGSDFYPDENVWMPIPCNQYARSGATKCDLHIVRAPTRPLSAAHDWD